MKELHLSIERTFDLYMYLLILPIELKAQGEHRLAEGKKKAMATAEDLNPNRKFVDNRLIQKLVDSSALQKLVEKRGISWSTQSELLPRFYKLLRDSDTYKNYMNSDKSSFKQDRDVLIDVFWFQ